MKRKTLAVSLSAILAASVLLDVEAIPKVGIRRVLLTMVVPVPAHLIHPTRPDTSGSGIQYDGDDVTITYWHTHGDSEEEVLVDTIIPEFEKQYPNIHVDAVRMPYDGLMQQIITSLSSGTGRI